MALTAAQVNKICLILSITKSFLNAHITSLGADLTAQDEIDIAVELARWTVSGGKFTKIQPNLANKGAEVMPELVKNDIRKNLATLLQLSYMFNFSSRIGTLQIGL